MSQALQSSLRNELKVITAQIDILQKQKAAIVQVLRIYGDTLANEQALSNVEMAKRILSEKGPMKIAEIKDEIFKVFGVQPSGNLTRMLLTAAKRKRFKVDKAGRYYLAYKRIKT